MLQPVQAEPAGLELVVAVRQPAVIGGDGADEGVDHRVLDHVAAVAVAAGARVLAPGVLGRLVLGERVGDQREQLDPAAERRADRACGRFADRAVMVGQLVQHRADGEVLAAQRHSHAGDSFVEQAAPGLAAGHILVVQQALGLIGELVRAEDAQIPQERPPDRERRVGELVVEGGVVQAVQLQREEDQVGADGGDALAAGLHEAADFCTSAVAGELQLGVGHHPAEHLLDRLVLGDGAGQPGGGQGGELARVMGGEADRAGVRGIQVGLQRRAVEGRIEVAEIPGGQRLGQGLGARRAGEAGGGEQRAGMGHRVEVLGRGGLGVT